MKETDAEKAADKAAKKLANKLADETPSDEQDGLFSPSTDLNAFGQIPDSTGAGGSFIDRRDQTKKA